MFKVADMIKFCNNYLFMLIYHLQFFCRLHNAFCISNSVFQLIIVYQETEICTHLLSISFKGIDSVPFRTCTSTGFSLCAYIFNMAGGNGELGLSTLSSSWIIIASAFSKLCKSFLVWFESLHIDISNISCLENVFYILYPFTCIKTLLSL